MKISYNWIKSYLPDLPSKLIQAGMPDIPDREKLADIFTYHLCEVESVEKLESGDYIFDLGILPNRAHDLLSHQGVARELSGLLGVPFIDPRPMYKTPESKPTNLKVEINSENCLRYSARIIRNIKVGPSPEWVVKHLESIGQRSINNIVDATNIVMYDCGQPTHSFDLRKLPSEKIIVTNAKGGEELPVVGRDGIIAKLTDTDLVITDGDPPAGEVLALGGVKGGRDSGISEDTTDIVIEVANFHPTSVRKTARRLGLLSDSAKRFENDLSPTLCESGMLELTGLLFEIFPDALFEDVVDIYPNPQKERIISFTKTHIEKLLGIEIPVTDFENILTSYDYSYTNKGDEYMMIVPPLRLDLTGLHDMAEEIGRVYGYDKVIPKLPEINLKPNKNEEYEKISQARNKFIEAGYKEVMTYAFANTGEVEVLASASDKKFMRTNLSDGLKKSYELNKLNAPLLRIKEIKIFEIGTIFENGSEEIHVAWNEKNEIKEMTLDNLTASSEVFLKRSSDLLAEDFDGQGQTISKNISDSAPFPFKMWSIYPFITRDIAVWVGEETSSKILSDLYQEFGTELLQGEPQLVDTFSKNGKTSYAFRLIFQSYDRTLTDDEVNSIMSKITEKISKMGFEVR